ncbi:MAG: hypothetical protein EBU90_16965 [Proteobacteria bacterium]|nr:hypothetical protein [Pseudomonadota bacterium]
MVNFYVYAYVREDRSPYYIGKGQGNRAWSIHNHISKPKNNSNIIIMENNLSEIGAFALERRYIKWYGRKNNNTGILRNLTDGGDGTSGWKHSQETINKIKKANTGKKQTQESIERARLKNIGRKHTPEVIEKIRNAGKNRIISEETRQKLMLSKIGTTHSQETKQKLREINLGKKQSLETILKRKETKQLNNKIPQYKQKTCPYCGKTGVSFNMTRYHFDKCKSK